MDQPRDHTKETLFIDGNSRAADLVKQEHCLAEVFRRYDISYCCGGNWPLQVVCDSKGIIFEDLRDSLLAAAQQREHASIASPEAADNRQLVEHILQLQHPRLREQFPVVSELLADFLEEHEKKYPKLLPTADLLRLFESGLLPLLERKESTAFADMLESAAARNSFVEIVHAETLLWRDHFYPIRQITAQFTPPAKACTSHHVVFAKLQSLETSFLQMHFLENAILKPRIVK